MTTAQERARPVRLLFLDVDGTLTDGSLYYHGNDIGRRFHALDGHGIVRFIAAGGIVAIVTAAEGAGGDGIRERAEKLGIHHLHLGIKDKLTVVQSVLAAESLTPREAAYAGDDIQDLTAMRHVGFACAPATAMPEVLAAAHYVPTRPAGAGAVREICEFILSAREAPTP